MRAGRGQASRPPSAESCSVPGGIARRPTGQARTSWAINAVFVGMPAGSLVARFVGLGLLAAAAVFCVASVAAAPVRCTHGVSSVGPAVLINGHLARVQSDLSPHTQPCLP